MRLYVHLPIALFIGLVWLPYTAAVSPAWAGGMETGQSDQGRVLALRLCARCHSVDKTGSSPLLAAPPFRTLGERWPVGHIAEALAEGISTRHPAMPVFELNPVEIEDLIAWLEELHKPRR